MVGPRVVTKHVESPDIRLLRVGMSVGLEEKSEKTIHAKFGQHVLSLKPRFDFAPKCHG